MRPEKKYLIAQIEEIVSQSGYVIATHYLGLSVEQFSDLRIKLEDADARIHVVKNSLLKRVVSEMGVNDSAIEDILSGPTAIVVGTGDVSAAAKVIKDFAKDRDLPQVRGGVLQQEVLSAQDVQAIAELPSREVLYAQLLGVLNAPATNLVGVLNAAASSIVNVLKAYERKLEEG
jgi:large subunit ribosomal protein L10